MKSNTVIDRFERYAPPGYDWKGELKWLLAGLIAAFMWTFGYLVRLTAALEDLYIYDSYLGKRFLAEGKTMTPFVTLPGESFKGFSVFAVLMIAVAIVHYMYFFRGSRSIYTMRRLPKRSEIWKRCIITPLIWVLICIVFALFVLALDYGIYFLVTPRACLPQTQPGITLRWLMEVFI